jgi:hypothetical protein
MNAFGLASFFRLLIVDSGIGSLTRIFGRVCSRENNEQQEKFQFKVSIHVLNLFVE